MSGFVPFQPIIAAPKNTDPVVLNRVLLVNTVAWSLPCLGNTRSQGWAEIIAANESRDMSLQHGDLNVALLGGEPEK